MTSSPPCSNYAEAGVPVSQIAHWLDGIVHGDATRRVKRLAALDQADAQCLAFVAIPRHLEAARQSRAGVLLLPTALYPTWVAQPAPSAEPVLVCVADAQAGFAHLTSRLYAPRGFVPGVAPQAVIDPSVHIPEDAAVGPGAIIAADTEIGSGVYVGAGVYIGRGVRIGAGSYLHPGCRILDATEMGQRVIVHSGAVLGADGFGYAQQQGVWLKIEQLGRVVIGDDVEIGANTTIDRGALHDTIIGAGVKIDNQVHIAHNVVIGDHTAIAGCVCIAGSARIGQYCAIGGGAGILGHLEIADRVIIHAMTFVTRSITQPGQYASGVPHAEARSWNRNLAVLRRLGRRTPR